jgi:hypothetical protein
MSDRVWTVEELDIVHPLPKAEAVRYRYPYAWRVDSDGPVAFEVGPSEPDEVWVDARGHLASATGEPPADVALAVILASKGLDSMEAMAREMDTKAGEMTERSRVGGGFSDTIHAAIAQGRAVQAVEDAATLRRGTVKA